MKKKYIVHLMDEEGRLATEVVKCLNGSPQKVRRAQILVRSKPTAYGRATLNGSAVPA